MKLKQWLNAKIVLIVLCLVGVLSLYFFAEKDITSYAVVSCVGFDLDGEQYTATAQLITSTESGTKKAAIVTATGTGSTPGNALKNIELGINKELKLNQCVLVLAGENVFQSNVMELMPALLEKNVQHRTLVAAIAGNAKDIFDRKLFLDEDVVTILTGVIFSGSDTAYMHIATIKSILTGFCSESQAGFVPLLELRNSLPETAGKSGGDAEAEKSGEGATESDDGKGDAAEAEKEKESDMDTEAEKDGETCYFDYSRTLLMRGGVKTGILNKEETIGFNILTKPLNNIYCSFDFEGKTCSADVTLMLKKSTYRLVDGVPTVTCRIKADIKSMEVLDSGSKSDYMLRAHGGMTGKAKEAAVRHIHSYLTAVTEKQKSTDTDFLKLGRKFYANLGREWTTFSAITSDYLQTTVYDINIEL